MPRFVSGHAAKQIHWQPIAPVAGTRELKLPRRADRPARTAELAVRFRAVELRPPARHAVLPPVRVWAVRARETLRRWRPGLLVQAYHVRDGVRT